MKIKALILVVMMVFGFLVSKQLYLREDIRKVTDPESVTSLASAVAETINSTTKLRKELTSLEKQRSELENSSDSNEAQENTLAKEINRLKIASGTTKVAGQGVEIVFDKSIGLSQLVDLVNALRNIGAEAISVNNTRIIASTSLEESMLSLPVNIKAIGDKKVLSDSLLRRGGIIEQIGGDGKVNERNNLELDRVN